MEGGFEKLDDRCIGNNSPVSVEAVYQLGFGEGGVDLSDQVLTGDTVTHLVDSAEV